MHKILPVIRPSSTVPEDSMSVPTANHEKQGICKIQRHPLGLLRERLERMLNIDRTLAKKPTRQDIKDNLFSEIEGLAVLTVHDMSRLLWELRYQGHYETLED
ncbi:hypothetical protein KAR91_51590 [Candidatus Pacearchaeota archaeon]|nr:hypothetical protein [Candidatus Pacearchaeota archaeon]